jgi:hypothetical protein
MKLDYLAIKELAKELGRPASTLYALSTVNDPFYIVPWRQALAEWFAEEWRRLEIPTGWHYRRIHYVFVSQDGKTAVKMLDRKPYQNTFECWIELCHAARDAIALGLVPQDAFVDHRNAQPIIHLVDPQPASAEIIDADPECWVPAFPSLPELTFHRPVVPQPYHVEIWAEKTTVNDVLEPLGRQYKFNLVTGVGELSATRCREFVDRAAPSGRPVRILYISDFDPGGASMPVAVAVKIQHEIDKRGLNLDVQLRPIVLTHEQCVEYRLPRTPLKETERRAARFEERFGEGGTELDALEALHPGLLRRIVLREIKRYWNAHHDGQVWERCEQIEDELGEVTSTVHDAYEDEIASLKAEWQKIVAIVKAWEERAKPTWQAIANSLEQECPPVGEVACPEFAADEDPDPLFDSIRSYLEQIDRYKAHQGKRTQRKPRKTRGSA